VEQESDVEHLLSTTETIAVVGCSRDPSKDAHSVPAFLQSVGYTIVPINPYGEEILGEKCYDDFSDVKSNHDRELDLVDVFRPSVEVPGILDDVLEIGIDAVWLQRGIRHDQARDRAQAQGIHWVQDRCMLAEYQRRHGTQPKDKI